MSLLEQYEQQYAALVAEITIKIGKLKTSAGVERRDLSSTIDANLAEARELLEQIGLEIRDLPTSQRSGPTSKLNCAYAELQRLQSDYRSIKDLRAHSADPLGYTTINFENGDYIDDDDVAISTDQRQRLLDNSDRIERTGRRLTDGYRVALETETIGAQVLNDLHHQRETIQSAQARLRETNADLGRASRTLNNMMYRAMRDKAVLYIVGVCFVLAVGLSLYLSFSSSTTPSSA